MNIEAIVQRCSVKKVFLGFNKIHRKAYVSEFLFQQNCRPETLQKKRHWHKCFLINFVKFLNNCGGCFCEYWDLDSKSPYLIQMLENTDQKNYTNTFHAVFYFLPKCKGGFRTHSFQLFSPKSVIYWVVNMPPKCSYNWSPNLQLFKLVYDGDL